MPKQGVYIAMKLSVSRYNLDRPGTKLPNIAAFKTKIFSGEFCHHQHQQNGGPEMGQISKQQVNRQHQRKRLTQIFQYLQGWNSTFAI